MYQALPASAVCALVLCWLRPPPAAGAWARSSDRNQPMDIDAGQAD